MATPVRVQLKRGAVEQLLKGPEITRLLTDMGQSIARAAGPGHEVNVDRGPNRVRVEVVTSTFEAMRNEARTRALTRAVQAGRR